MVWLSICAAISDKPYHHEASNIVKYVDFMILSYRAGRKGGQGPPGSAPGEEGKEGRKGEGGREREEVSAKYRLKMSVQTQCK
jgi:hypothetical protein